MLHITDGNVERSRRDGYEGQMQTRRIGDHDVSAIGLGAMPLTMDQRPTEEDAIATVHAALDAGVTLIDTADAYTWAERGPGANEEVVGVSNVGAITPPSRSRRPCSWKVPAMDTLVP